MPMKHTQLKKEWPPNMLSVDSKQLVCRVPSEVSVAIKMSSYEPHNQPQGEITIQIPWKIKELDLKQLNATEVQKLMTSKGVQLLLQSKPLSAPTDNKVAFLTSLLFVNKRLSYFFRLI
jgi:hypothetical protein